MAFLLDANVLSELRKGKRANPNVISWARAHCHDRIYISVLSIGEIRNTRNFIPTNVSVVNPF